MLLGRLTIDMAPNGHFLMQMPQPMQGDSEIQAILLCDVTSMQSLPMRTTGQLFLHSCRHFLGLHLSWFTIAILVGFSDILAAFSQNLDRTVPLTEERPH
uniref:Uncharacterized protein n=1 Tax=Anguilla anguilla TaxID=7936 RepID=A0A0E9UE69_ANGAN